MNIINRLIAVLLAVVLWLALVALALAPTQALAWARQALNRIESNLAQATTTLPDWLYLLARLGVVVVVSLLLAVWMMQQLRRKAPAVVTMRLPSGGQAEVTAESVSRRLAWHIDQLADVNQVTPVVRTRGRAMDVDINLQTAPDVDVPLKTEEVVAVARDVIETQMGLQLNRIKVNIDHAPYRPLL
ncbi:MAG: hypothetical protein ABTQ73_10650 [Caldilineales bacterium]